MARARSPRLHRLRKLAKLVPVRSYRAALRLGVAAAVEHERVAFEHAFRTVIDVGAHNGQFALFAAHRFPGARLICVEPLPAAQHVLARVVPQAKVIAAAASETYSTRDLHIARASDSSSLLPIVAEGIAAFPGARQETAVRVSTQRLDGAVGSAALARPVLMKIDVQGAELGVLRGSEGILNAIDEILVECSFVELYEGQPLAGEIVEHLVSRGFVLAGVFTVVRDSRGRCLQADFLFVRPS